MKKCPYKFHSLFVSCAVILLAVVFASCSAFEASEQTGSVSFSIDSKFIKSALTSSQASREAGDEPTSEVTPEEDYYKARFTVGLCGDYAVSKSVVIDVPGSESDTAGTEKTEDSDSAQEGRFSPMTITFDNIPVGANVRAAAILIIESKAEAESFSWIDYYGLSEPIKISAGDNDVKLPMKSFGAGESVWSYTGEAAEYDDSFSLSALGTNDSREHGPWQLDYYGTNEELPVQILSIGTWDTVSKDSDGKPEVVSFTEYFYLKDGSYHIVSKPSPQEVSNSNDYFTLKSTNGANVKFITKYPAGGSVDFDNDLKTYTIKRTDSTENFYLNSCPLSFTLVDESGNDVFAGIDWSLKKDVEQDGETYEISNLNILNLSVDVAKGNSSLGNILVQKSDENQNIINPLEFELQEPLIQSGWYQVTVSFSTGVESIYLNDDKELLEFPAFEPVTETFGIYVEDKSYYELDLSGIDSTTFDDTFGSFLNGVYAGSSNSIVKLFGETDQDYNTVFSTIKSHLSNFNYLIDLDCSELTNSQAGQIINSGSGAGCSAFGSIIFPDDLIGTEYTAFSVCENLKSVTFGSQLEKLGQSGTFRECSSLETVIFGKNCPLKVIDASTFTGCTSLKEFTIPSTVVAIGSGSFYGTQVTELQFEGEVGTWYYTDTQSTWNQWIAGTATPADTNKVSGMTAIDSYDFATNGISTDAQKITVCTKCIGDTQNNDGPAQAEIYLYRKTE